MPFVGKECIMKNLFFILVIAFFTASAFAQKQAKTPAPAAKTITQKLAKMPCAFRATFDAAMELSDDSTAAFKFAELIYRNYSDVYTRSKKLTPVAHNAKLGQISFEAIASMSPDAAKTIPGDTSGITVMEYHKQKAAHGDYSGLQYLFKTGLAQFVTKTDTNWVRIADYFTAIYQDSTETESDQ